jgi:hypothetical protein
MCLLSTQAKIELTSPDLVSQFPLHRVPLVRTERMVPTAKKGLLEQRLVAFVEVHVFACCRGEQNLITSPENLSFFFDRDLLGKTALPVSRLVPSGFSFLCPLHSFCVLSSRWLFASPLTDLSLSYPPSRARQALLEPPARTESTESPGLLVNAKPSTNPSSGIPCGASSIQRRASGIEGLESMT